MLSSAPYHSPFFIAQYCCGIAPHRIRHESYHIALRHIVLQCVMPADQVAVAVDVELAKNLGGALGAMLQPSGELGKVVAANVEVAAAAVVDRVSSVEAATAGTKV
jgi:hypothetical protein